MWRSKQHTVAEVSDRRLRHDEENWLVPPCGVWPADERKSTSQSDGHHRLWVGQGTCQVSLQLCLSCSVWWLQGALKPLKAAESKSERTRLQILSQRWWKGEFPPPISAQLLSTQSHRQSCRSLSAVGGQRNIFFEHRTAVCKTVKARENGYTDT